MKDGENMTANKIDNHPNLNMTNNLMTLPFLQLVIVLFITSFHYFFSLMTADMLLRFLLNVVFL